MKAVTLHVALVLLLGGCASSKPAPTHRAFAFDYAGETYEILSMTAPTGEANNLLILREDRRFLMQAVDQNQDGTLDTLLFGRLTLAHANEIYATGIAASQSSGKFKKRKPAQVMITLYNRIYAIQTYATDADGWYNKFILYDPILEAEVVLVDINADGILDRTETVNYDPSKGQAMYERTLELGIQEGNIEKQNNRFKVKAEGRPVPG